MRRLRKHEIRAYLRHAHDGFNRKISHAIKPGQIFWMLTEGVYVPVPVLIWNIYDSPGTIYKLFPKPGQDFYVTEHSKLNHLYGYLNNSKAILNPTSREVKDWFNRYHTLKIDAPIQSGIINRVKQLAYDHSIPHNS